MADIELAIKLPEDVFKRTVFYREFRDLNDCVTIIKALEKAVPLPKGHTKWIEDNCELRHSDTDGSWYYALSKEPIETCKVDVLDRIREEIMDCLKALDDIEKTGLNIYLPNEMRGRRLTYQQCLGFIDKHRKEGQK